MKHHPESGFTLTELVVVIVIAGILAVIAYSAIDVTSTKANAFAAQARSAVRYAQKVSVAQRRNVYVCVAASSLSLYYASDCSTTPVSQPSTSSPFAVSAPSTVTLSPVGVFSFDSLGRPSAATVLTINSPSPQVITVEAESGFVH